MARRRKNDATTQNDTSMQDWNRSLGYSDKSLKALESGTYGQLTNRKSTSMKSEDQTRIANPTPLPVLEGINTNNSDWESSFGRAKQYQKNLENEEKKYQYNESAAQRNSLDEKDQGYLQRLVDRFGDGDLVRSSLSESKKNEWEKKYGKSIDRIYADFIADQGNAKMRQGQENSITSTLAATLGEFGKPIEAIPHVISHLIDPDSEFAKGSEKARAEYSEQLKRLKAGVKENLGNTGDKVYDTATQVGGRMLLNTAGNILGGPLGAGILTGLADYSDQMDELNLRPGMSGRQKAASALAHGTVEGAGNAITRGLLDGLPTVAGVGGKLINVGKGAGNAAIENSISEAIEMGLDTAINGENSEKALNKAIYMMQGMSEADAEKQAKSDQWNRVLGAAGTGALFGGFTKGLGEALDSVKNIPALKGLLGDTKFEEARVEEPKADTPKPTFADPDRIPEGWTADNLENAAKAIPDDIKNKVAATIADAENTDSGDAHYAFEEIIRNIDSGNLTGALNSLDRIINSTPDGKKKTELLDLKARLLNPDATPIETPKVEPTSAPNTDVATRYAQTMADYDNGKGYFDDADLKEMSEELADDIARGNDLTKHIETLEENIEDADNPEVVARMQALVDELNDIQNGKITEGTVNTPDGLSKQNKGIDSKPSMEDNNSMTNTIRISDTDSEGTALSPNQIKKFEKSKVRDDNGNLIPMYHGTNQGGFDTFDPSKSDDMRSLFFTSDLDVAKTYSDTDQLFEFKKSLNYDELKEAIREYDPFDNYRFIKDGNEYVITDRLFGDDEVYRGDLKGAQDYFSENIKDAVDETNINYKSYLNLENPLVVDANGKSFDKLDFNGLKSTREIAEYAYNNGYDGVVFKNLYDVGPYGEFTMGTQHKPSTVAVAFSPDQIKDVNDPLIEFDAVDNVKPTSEAPAEEVPNILPTASNGGSVPPEPPKGPETDISRRYETLKNSDLFQKSQANMKMLETAKEQGIFNKDVEERAKAQEDALKAFTEDPTKAINDNLDKQWTSGQDLDTSMLVLNDALESGDQTYTNLVMLKQAQQTKNAGRVLRAALDYAKRNYAGTKESTLQEAAKFLNDKAEAVLSNRKTAEQFNAIAERIMKGDLSDLNTRFNMDDVNIQNIKDALEAGAGKADIAHMIAMYQSVGKTGISAEALQKITDIYNQIQAQNLEPNSRARANLEADAFKVLAKDIGGKRTFKEQWDAWRYLAMLGNPKTHLRNLLGNATHYMVTEAKDNIGAVIEGAVDKANRAAGREGIERTKAVLTAKDSGLVKAGEVDADDVAYAALNDSGNKYNVKNEIERAMSSFNNKALSRIDELNSNLLDLEDYSALKRKYSKSLARFLKANGADESIFKATDDASKELLDKGRAYAIDQAKQATFHEYSQLANALNTLSKNLRESDNLGTKAAGVAVEGLVPFKKTPINILKQAGKYSPISLATGVKKAFDAVKTGNSTAAEAIEDLSAGMTGSMIMGLGAFLAHEGYLTGGANADYTVDNAETEQGAQNYALKIGDNSYTLDWLAPMALPLFVGAELMRESENGGEGDALDRVISSISTIAEPITEMSMLQGIQNILNELSYSKENAIATFGTNATLGYATQGIPTLFGQIARAADDTRRSTYTDQPAGYKRQVDKTITKTLNKLPFISMASQPYVDSSGNEQQNEGLATALLGNNFGTRLADQMLSPGYFKQGTITETDKELNRLYEATGENVYKDIASGKIGNNPDKISKENFTKYQKLYGSNNDYLYDEIIKTDAYKNLDDAEKVKTLDALKSASKMIADHEIGGKELKKSEQTVYDIYKSQGKKGLLKYFEDKATAESLGMKYDEYIKKESETPGGAEQWAADKQAAEELGFVNKDGRVDTSSYQKAIGQAGDMSQKFISDLPVLQDLGLERSAYYTYANAINEIPSLTPSEFAQTYEEINTNPNNAITQKELLDYINSFEYDDPSEAEDLWYAYGGWTKKDGTPKKLKWDGKKFVAYY